MFGENIQTIRNHGRTPQPEFDHPECVKAYRLAAIGRANVEAARPGSFWSEFMTMSDA